jgi:hypothetical protein
MRSKRKIWDKCDSLAKGLSLPGVRGTPRKISLSWRGSISFPHEGFGNSAAETFLHCLFNARRGTLDDRLVHTVCKSYITRPAEASAGNCKDTLIDQGIAEGNLVFYR